MFCTPGPGTLEGHFKLGFVVLGPEPRTPDLIWTGLRGFGARTSNPSRGTSNPEPKPRNPTPEHGTPAPELRSPAPKPRSRDPRSPASEPRTPTPESRSPAAESRTSLVFRNPAKTMLKSCFKPLVLSYFRPWLQEQSWQREALPTAAGGAKRRPARPPENR